MRSRHERAIGVACFLFALAGGSALLRPPADSPASRAPASVSAVSDNPDQRDSEVPVDCITEDDGLQRGCARYSFLDAKCGFDTYAFIQGSCFMGLADRPIDEIVNPAAREFPRALLGQYDLSTLARNLVYRVYLQRERPRIGHRDFADSDYSFYHRLQLQIAFDFNLLDAIVANGFLNQHQTASTRGSFNPKMRLRAEETMAGGMSFGAAYSDPRMKILLPKYLYAAPSTSRPSLRPHGYVSQYGNVLAVLKDDVRNRTTFTTGDSLKLAASAGYANGLRTLKWIRGSLAGFGSIGGTYWEGQVWGPLTLRNVKYFLLGCDVLGQARYRHARAIADKTGLPVYSCRTLSVGAGSYYVADELLAGAEDPQNLPMRWR